LRAGGGCCKNFHLVSNAAAAPPHSPPNNKQPRTTLAPCSFTLQGAASEKHLRNCVKGWHVQVATLTAPIKNNKYAGSQFSQCFEHLITVPIRTKVSEPVQMFLYHQLQKCPLEEMKERMPVGLFAIEIFAARYHGQSFISLGP